MTLSRRTTLILALGLLAGTDLPALAQDTAVFPVTIEHAWGETEIAAEPQRIVTWGWFNEDALLALGIVPLAMPFQSYGGGEDGIQPWVEETLAEMGAETPTILEQSTEPPYEQIAALGPDLIVATYSGVTEEQYAILSRIAPTLAYQGDPWSAPWQDVLATVGQATGRSAEADAVRAETEAFIEDAVAARPELLAKSFAAVSDYDGSIAVFDGLDARVKFLEDLGLVLAPSVGELSPGGSGFYYSLSHERFDALTSDIIVTFFDTEEAETTFFAQPYVESLPQNQTGAVAALTGIEAVAAVSPPSPLSIPWGLEPYLDVLAAAARNSEN